MSHAEAVKVRNAQVSFTLMHLYKLCASQLWRSL